MPSVVKIVGNNALGRAKPHDKNRNALTVSAELVDL